MGFFNEETLPMLEVYQQEMLSLEGELNQILAGTEMSRAFSIEDIHHVFRIVHTMKSSSAMMGMMELSHYAHKLEDLFQIYRNKEVLSSRETELAMELLYEFLEYVEGELLGIADDDFSPQDTAVQMAHLEEVMGVMGEKTEAAVELCVSLKKSCPMKAVRAFILINELKKCADIEKYTPDDLDDDLASDKITAEGLHLWVGAAKIEAVLEKIKKDNNVDQVQKVTKKAEKVPEPQKVQKPEKHQQESEKLGNAKFTNIKWENVSELSDCIGELLVAYSVFENERARLGNPKGLDQFGSAYLRIVKNLDQLTQSISMMAVTQIVPKLYRTVREVAKSEGKDIELHVQGEELEIDKKRLELLSKPLTHVLRNAVDHGIEMPQERIEKGKSPKGHIYFNIENDGSVLSVSVKDDGKGMDVNRILDKAEKKGLLKKQREVYTKAEILNFVLQPGFSTNDTANEFSGRGVGMDVVRDAMDEAGGSVTIKSVVDEGTTIVMKLPVTMTSVESIQFHIGTFECLLPIRQVLWVYTDADRERIVEKEEGRYFEFDHELLPVFSLKSKFGEETSKKERYYLILQGLKYKICLLTDDIVGETIAVEKPLPSILGTEYSRQTGISGLVLLGSGEIGYMLNADLLFRLYRREQRNAVTN